MRTVHAIAEVREALRGPRREERSVGLVPTMGAFHEGHLALIDRARRECDFAVVSLFVNPTQFNEREDLAAYPRDEGRDALLAEEHGADLLFAPTVSEIYPHGFSTAVAVSGLTERLEGEHRGPQHFGAVTTVVTKLFNIVAPDVAYFGQKDAQQALVITRMVADLNQPVRVVICPTVREPDGLAMSSRNVRLSPAEREQALALRASLLEAERIVAAGVEEPELVIAPARRILGDAGIEPEYLEVVAADTLAPVDRLDRPALAVIAARVGETRLIDNQPLMPAASRRDGNGRP